MLTPRLIPVLLFKNGVLVRSQKFHFYQSTGDPITQVERFADWRADELIYLDITQDDAYNSTETMQVIGSTTSKKGNKITSAKNFIEVVQEVSKRCFIPLTVGGKIRTLEDVRLRIKSGADKVSINTAALERPDFISEVAEKFGSQAVVVSIDFVYKDGKREVYSHGGTKATGWELVAWAKKVQEHGAGEILLNSIDRDGAGSGYDLTSIRAVVNAVQIPVIAHGGVGEYKHFVEGLDAGASAVAAANIFHFREQSIIEAKKYLRNSGVLVRL